MLQNAAPLIVFVFIFGPSRNYVVSAFKKCYGQPSLWVKDSMVEV
jgi:hypothetical protein